MEYEQLSFPPTRRLALSISDFQTSPALNAIRFADTRPRVTTVANIMAAIKAEIITPTVTGT